MTTEQPKDYAVYVDRQERGRPAWIAAGIALAVIAIAAALLS